MKIAIITPYGGWGSTGKITDNIAKVAEMNGYECYLAYGFFESAHEKKLKLKTGAKFMSLLEILRTRVTGYMGYTSKHATRKLIKWIEEIKPDVINLHNAHGGYVHIEMLFAFLKRANIPVVWTIHDCWSFTGHCAHFDSLGCVRWKTGCFDCPDRKLKKSFPISYFFDRSKEQYERKKNAFTGVNNLTIVTPSNWLADFVKQSYLSYADVCTIHNGINLQVFRPIESDVKNRYGCENKKLVLGVSMGWSERKGYNYMIQLSERLPKDKYQIMLVGLNEKQMKVLPANIIGITRTANQQELAKLYSAADVFVNPTLSDTYPTVNLEAIACGTPVVTFKTGGSPESITEKTGAVVEQHDIDALVREVIRWGDRSVGAQCRAYAVEHFEGEKCFEEYIALFHNLFRK